MTNARRIVDAGWPEDKDKHKSSPIKDKIKKARQSRKKNWEKRIDKLARQIYDDLKVEETILDAAQSGMAKKIWNFTESKTFREKIRMNGIEEYNKEILTQLNLKKEYEFHYGSIIEHKKEVYGSDEYICDIMGFVELVNNIEITPKHIISRLKEIFIQNGIDPIKIKQTKFDKMFNEDTFRTIFPNMETGFGLAGSDNYKEAYEKLLKLKFYEYIEYRF